MKTCSVHLYYSLIYSAIIYAYSNAFQHPANTYEDRLPIKKSTAKKNQTYTNHDCLCGVSHDSDRRIVGGKATMPNQYPWQVGLSEREERPYCGGVLISDIYVLTAGHCVHGQDPSNIVVILGEHDFNNNEDMGFHVPVLDMILHKNFNKETIANDIGLVRMQQRITFSDVAMPPCFPPPDLNYDNELALVTGWGRLVEDGNPSDILREVEVPIIPIEECTRRYEGEMTILYTMICAAWPNGKKDACEGDSGGPLVWKTDGRWYLIGLVSFGFGCARADQPAIYTRVDRFYNWIEEHTHNATMCSA